MNILLIGLRGSGKTTVGRLVAERFRRPFVDLDDVTARELGTATVGQAWRSRGQSRFRSTEAASLRRVLDQDQQVVALGGGTPTAPGAGMLLEAARQQGRGRVVYLRADAPTLRERLRTTDLAQRPSLTGGNALDEIGVVLAERDPLYLRLADLVIQTDGHTPEEAAELVVLGINI